MAGSLTDRRFFFFVVIMILAGIELFIMRAFTFNDPQYPNSLINSEINSYKLIAGQESGQTVVSAVNLHAYRFRSRHC